MDRSRIMTNKPVDSSNSIILVGNPKLGASVWFDVDVNSRIKNPMIELDAYQNGVIVWAAIEPIGGTFVLGGMGYSPWREVGGDADCVAYLVEFLWKGNTEQGKNILATTHFKAIG